MLQGDRARGVRGFGPRRGGGIRAGARGGDSGLGAGWGDSDSGRGVWIRAPGARWDGDSGPGRGVGIQALGAGWGFFW